VTKLTCFKAYDIHDQLGIELNNNIACKSDYWGVQ